MVIALVLYGAAKSLPLSFWMLPLYFFLFIGCYCAVLVITRSIDGEDISLVGAILESTGVEAKWLKNFLQRAALRPGEVKRGNT